MPEDPKKIEPAEIIPDRCIGCQVCLAECPVEAIQISPEGTVVIDPQACIACRKCADVCPVNAVLLARKPPRLGPEGRPPEEVAARHKGVAVFIEVADGVAAPVSWELVGKGRELAEKLQTRVIGLLLGHRLEPLAGEAIAYGCDEVHLIDDPRLERYLSAPYGEALTHLCQAVRPEIFLLGATALGRDLSGIVATRLETGLTADCTGLEIDPATGFLLMTRPTFGGNILATIFCQRHRPQMSTVRPQVMKAPSRDGHRTGEIRRHHFTPPPERGAEFVAFVPEPPRAESADIVRSPALVVAGRGACDPAAFPLLQELAALVGGVVACSRPVVESGLMPYERQVGQTGKTVAPKLYIGIGVSGAVQHLVGMQGSEKILAINSDPEAPIFRVADLGLVGNYQQVVPALIAGLRERRAKAKGAGNG